MQGLHSSGNACFMNSVVQCLVHTQRLVDFFAGDGQQVAKGQLASEFRKLVRDLWNPSNSGDALRPLSFRAKVSEIAPQFGGHAQNDAQEFLAFLLGALHEDLSEKDVVERAQKSARKGKGSSKAVGKVEGMVEAKLQSGSIIVDLFQGQLRSTVSCPGCSNSWSTLEPFLHLSLPVQEEIRAVKITVVGVNGIRTVTVMPREGRRVADLAKALGEGEHTRLLVVRNKREVLLDTSLPIQVGDIVVAFKFQSRPQEQDVLWLEMFFEHLSSSSAKKLSKLVEGATCQAGKAMSQHILDYLKSGRRLTGSCVSLRRCLEDFLAEETLGDWFCSHCKRQEHATRKVDLWELPNILILHLKRFSFRGSQGEKITTKIDLPLDDFDAGKYLGRGDIAGVYELYAVIENDGDFSSSHYTATTKLKDQGWFRFNDASVTSVPPPASSDSAYVLFYMRKEAD